MNIQRRKQLGPYNTLALQAHADAFVRVDTEAELYEALVWARAQRLPVVPLGEGSNVVLAGNIQALILRQNCRGIQLLESGTGGVQLRVAAGESWHQLVQWTLQKGYYGLENLALIPGTVGAAPIQNIGAYGVELQSVLLRVHALRIADSQRIILEAPACEFAYRDSIFKRELRDKLVITAVDLNLALQPKLNISYPALASYFQEYPGIQPTARAVFDAVVSIRSSKLPNPSVEPNAGSFFKNPLLDREVAEALTRKNPDLPSFPQIDGRNKVSAAWMIDQCGWKGFQRDGLGIHQQHALVMVNYGSNNGTRLLALAAEVAASVYEMFGVQLEIEPRLYGDKL